ncbi:MAG: Gfo/Idh/MocA family oxidoreductase [Candidatus Hydrogenedentes bacterium]|nr:Gfo/Idh/MocA family oxidoreductase [Candidatus Hydrogenedentota bacterium]
MSSKSGKGATRREFIRQSVAAGAAAGMVLGQSAASAPRVVAGRVIGANDRINIGLIGCGGRGRWVVQNMFVPANANTALVAACDIWKKRQEEYPGEAEKAYGLKPKMYADYRKLLEDPDVDAVLIATPDHLHCGQATAAVLAGKHVYVEKPLASVLADLPELNKCYETVKASKMAVQMGTQGVSSPGARAIKQFIADKKMGQLFRVESSESTLTPYWVNYKGPQTEAETDWPAFLGPRPMRPFDAHMHACWMGYYELSSGAIGGWMSHFINAVHFVTGCGMPVSATAWGGRYECGDDPRCTCPDQLVVMLDYADGFHTQFTSHFGSCIDAEMTRWMFQKGVIKSGFGHDLANPVASTEGCIRKFTEEKLLDTDPPYPGPEHAKNWFDCIRNGNQPNANIEFGYMHAIAVLLGDQAYVQKRKVTFDPATREIKTP